MKAISAAEMKGYHSGRDLSAPPKEGSNRRALYDLLMAHKAEVVDIRGIPFTNRQMRLAAICALRAEYGLDIRLQRRFHYMLVGEWCGRVYVDYLAEKIDEDARNTIATDRCPN